MITSLAEINRLATEDAEGFISLCEKDFDKEVTSVVDTFLSDSRRDIVLLAGPSSSGKTTTAGKIAEKIRQRGRNAFTVSLDDFYRNRDDIPEGEDGVKDFENVTALDLDLIHKVFAELIEYRKAELPIFDFKCGVRSEKTRHIELGRDDVIVVEGLHSLNPIITEGLDETHLYKIYISVSSRVNDENGTVLMSKRNLRLVRRMIRDAKHRNVTAEKTFDQWGSVLSGEVKYLFQFETNADIKINSFHPYEVCIYKSQVLYQLDTIGRDSECYDRACEIKRVFESFCQIEPNLLPEDSLLCEFIR